MEMYSLLGRIKSGKSLSSPAFTFLCVWEHNVCLLWDYIGLQTVVISYRPVHRAAQRMSRSYFYAKPHSQPRR